MEEVKAIDVNGEIYWVSPRATVRAAVNAIREFFGLQNGGLVVNDRENLLLEEVLGDVTGALSFVGGRSFVPTHPIAAPQTAQTVDPYLAALREQNLLLSRQLEEQRNQRQSRIFSRQVYVQDVNVSLLNFVLDTANGEQDGGIRQYLVHRARDIGVTGYVRRTYHNHLIVRYDGNAEQVRRFKAVLDNLQNRRICAEIVPVAEFVKDFEEPELSDFSILSNIHGCCADNPLSNGGQWERHSSSVGSGGHEVSRFG